MALLQLRRRWSRFRARLLRCARMHALLLGCCCALVAVRPCSAQGLMDDERLYAPGPDGYPAYDGTWHREQRNRISFEAACYFSNEPELAQGCQYADAIDKNGQWRTQPSRVKQKKALQRFYEAMDGKNWRFDDNWMNGDPCWDYWYGLTCDEHGNVIYLELTDNRLKGVLPGLMKDLKYLLRIDLSSTEEMYFGHPNKYMNKIIGPMPSLGDAVNLAELEISGNQITALPDLTPNAGSLRSVSASRNHIYSLPPGIAKMTKLHTLELSWNRISSPITVDFTAMIELRRVHLDYNWLRGTLPIEITRLTKMETFDVSHNPDLNGEIAQEIIVAWPKIEYISTYNTSITGYISELCYDVPICEKFMFDTHRDMTWATVIDIPQIVNATMELAMKFNESDMKPGR